MKISLESGKAAWVRRWSMFGVVALMSMVCVDTALAQSVASGTIEGTVKDESNAVLPGVTITVTSPQLQIGQLVQVSDSAGSYKFVDLPAGTYRLRAELTGFSSSIREDLRLTVGFNARIDLTLKLGAMEESVTVSGQSPVVDVSSTTASVAFTKEVLDAIPRGRDLQNVFAMAPGVTQAVSDVGGSTMAQRQNLSSYGVLSQPKLQVEGMNNMYAGLSVAPKYAIADIDTYKKGPEDDLYANFPVNYLKIDKTPGPEDDYSPVLKSLRDGNFFVTTGEILIRNYTVAGTGPQRTITADVDWTFPLNFVEVVWSDGKKVDRQVISATDSAPFGTRHFAIPFNATGKAWVRFAVWDSAGNGAFVQPSWLAPKAAQTTSSR